MLGASLAGGVGGAVADHLAGLRAPLVVAFDADDAGRQAAGRPWADLRERHAMVATLHVPEEAKDLNGWLRRGRDWPATLSGGMREAVAAMDGWLGAGGVPSLPRSKRADHARLHLEPTPGGVG